MSKSNFFAILSRMKYVDRWGLMRNSRKESLSEHTLDVIFISHALVSIANTYFGKSLDGGRAALLAAFHDAPEILTGDLPTPVKYFDPEIKAAYEHVEESAINSVLSTLPKDMIATYESAFKHSAKGDDELLPYIKAADKLSALIKCIEEEKSGNKDFESAKRATLEILRNLSMPEVDYFIENFLEGYCLTLDDLTKP